VPGGAPEILGGPVWWYFVAVYVIAIALAAYVLFDSQRAARAERLASLREPARLYPIASGVYLVCVVGVWIPAIPRAISVAPVLLTPFSLVLSVAYLLRVVFPKPPAPSEEIGTPVEDEDGGDDPARV